MLRLTVPACHLHWQAGSPPPQAHTARERNKTKYEARLDAAVSRWILGAMMAKNQRIPRLGFSPPRRAGKRVSIIRAAQTEAGAV